MAVNARRLLTRAHSCRDVLRLLLAPVVRERVRQKTDERAALIRSENFSFAKIAREGERKAKGRYTDFFSPLHTARLPPRFYVCFPRC